MQDNTARDILYPGITKYFTWNQNDKAWRRRKRGHVDADDGNFTSETLGRIPTISLSPKQSELHYLRMLLHNVAGAQSYEDLRTVDAELCPTFQAACNKLGLLEDDNEKDMIMIEAALLKFGPQLCDVFATILMFHRSADPKQFWEKWRLELCRDFMKRDRLSAPSEMIVNQVLFDLQDRVERDGLHLANNFQMPMPNPDIIAQLQTPRIIREEIEFDVVELQIRAEQGYATLNMEQKNVFDRIYNAVTNEDGQLFALNASGGTGKTHTINLLLSRLRSEGKIAIATALSGIAATLLENGRTLHLRCKVPLDIEEHSTCNMSKRDTSGKLFQRAKLLIIDEVSMGHRFIFEAIDRTLQDIRNNTEPFGGLSVVFVGDWKQILPVIPRGGRPQIVQACLKKSSLWSKVTTLTLSVNMRVSMGSADNNFAEYIMSVGNGLERIYTDIGLYKIRIPSQFLLASNTLADLCHFVFDHLESHYTDEKWLCSRAVIAPTNPGVLEVNNIMMEEFPGEARVYWSADTVDRESNTYPTEFLNKLNPPGFPPHSLVLKKHASIMLLRNMDAFNGHCNGTRYRVVELYDHIIEAEVATGVHEGKRLLIPRIPMVTQDSLLPFILRRKQFPIKPAFGITANKCQGQTLQRIGLYLSQDMFTHGQLYVALSRVQSPMEIKIVTKNASFRGFHGQYTDNVVYKDIVQ